MDDYFYPALEASENMNDNAEYEKYGKAQFDNIADFRRNNVNVVIQNIQKTIIETRPDVIFSISPAANMDNNYHMPGHQIYKLHILLKDDSHKYIVTINLVTRHMVVNSSRPRICRNSSTLQKQNQKLKEVFCIALNI